MLQIFSVKSPLFFLLKNLRTLQKIAFENDICKRSGKILHINILTEWGIMGFLYSKIVRNRGCLRANVSNIIKYGSPRTSTPNLRHVGVLLTKI